MTMVSGQYNSSETFQQVNAGRKGQSGSMNSSINPIFFAKIKDGNVLFSDKELLKAHLTGLEGKDVDVIVRRHRKDRTNSQNRYYWGCVVAIPAQHFGYYSEEMHDAFKWLFLIREEQGKPKTVRSTADLSTLEFTDYVEKCRQFCAENGLFIPDPDSVDIPENK